MPKKEVAAMPMKKYPTDVKVLYPKENDPDYLIKSFRNEPFSENAIAWLNDLSLVLNKDPETKKYSDVATFAFFCRKANIIQLKKKYRSESNLRLGRGLVFHITPKNVPTVFAYSLVCGILSGNANIVKVTSEESGQVDIVCRAIEELSKRSEYQPISSSLMIVSYNNKSSATEYFSSICDVRVIWGGDDTIDEIRKNRIAPRAFDVTFAFRYSLCVINADCYINEKSPEIIASGFYNDTYLFDQNACTSPHLIVWLGKNENIETAKRIFWAHLYDLVKTRYQIQPHICTKKTGQL